MMYHDRNLVPILDRGGFKAVWCLLNHVIFGFPPALCTTFVSYYSAARIGQRLGFGIVSPSRIINMSVWVS